MSGKSNTLHSCDSCAAVFCVPAARVVPEISFTGFTSDFCGRFNLCPECLYIIARDFSVKLNMSLPAFKTVVKNE